MKELQLCWPVVAVFSVAMKNGQLMRSGPIPHRPPVRCFLFLLLPHPPHFRQLGQITADIRQRVKTTCKLGCTLHTRSQDGLISFRKITSLKYWASDSPAILDGCTSQSNVIVFYLAGCVSLQDVPVFITVQDKSASMMRGAGCNRNVGRTGTWD
jgi:hypothetical protein